MLRAAALSVFPPAGCQMNVNDSEVIASVLGEQQYTSAPSATEAGVVLLNTCAIRCAPSVQACHQTALESVQSSPWLQNHWQQPFQRSERCTPFAAEQSHAV